MKPESAPAPAPALFRIGRNGSGNWVVQDRCRLRGGLFTSRTQAVKFARDVGGRAPMLDWVAGRLELDLGATPGMRHSR